MATSSVPELDEALRLRLGRRFGSAIDAWFDALPGVLADLAERWDIEWGTLIQRGSMSVVVRCRTADGRPAVLKASPERERVAHEAAALAGWETIHVPAVLAVDEGVGAPPDRGGRARDTPRRNGGLSDVEEPCRPHDITARRRPV